MFGWLLGELLGQLLWSVFIVILCRCSPFRVVMGLSGRPVQWGKERPLHHSVFLFCADLLSWCALFWAIAAIVKALQPPPLNL